MVEVESQWSIDGITGVVARPLRKVPEPGDSACATAFARALYPQASPGGVNDLGKGDMNAVGLIVLRSP